MGAGLRIRSKDGGLALIESSIFEEEGFIAAFTTRMGGWSPRPFDGLNMGFGVPDDPANVRMNRTAALKAQGLDPSAAAAMRQVHGDRIVEVTEALKGCGGLEYGKSFPSTDGMYTAIAGVALISTFADCVPVVVADRAARKIGLAHAGWRGTVLDVAVKLALRMGFDKGRAGDFMAAIGPSVGPCCYEVGDDVALALAGAGGAAALTAEGGKSRADLGLMNELRLIGLGFAPDRIERYEGCTSCEEGLFFSHRRDRGRTGRSAAIAAIAV